MKRALSSAAIGVLLALSAAPVAALTLEFPGPATELAHHAEMPGSYRLPIGAFAEGTLPSRLSEGAVSQSAFQIEAPGLTTLGMMELLREEVMAAGYSILFECETVACGGFDFRYATTVLPEPDMHVDLGDFRFLAAERISGTGTDVLSLLVSRSPDMGYVQITEVGPAAQGVVTALTTGALLQPNTMAGAAAETAQSETPQPETPQSEPVLPADLAARLEAGQPVALDDLVFAPGRATLEEGDYASLTVLAAWLQAHPDLKVTLVGHTDASGGLAGNIALSRRRAESVRQWLLSHDGLAPGQIAAEGVGFLAPRDTNLTEAGRTRNRRVEVMLTSTP